ncbi:MAG: hypothetical protein Unbinned3459contig1000_11 [Prokaryotic dsDNA virus sp.]|jgi:hypothetical protein|nr:MAG: hypothetical protein Unbinned3459contig1000_11 [Prokaryotic dsDNA virus sp.]
MSKCKSSQKRTKQEITTKHRKLTDSDIDIEVFQCWVDNLDSATKESFCSFAEETFSAIQVYLYAKFLGYNSSIVAVDLWLKDNFSKPDHLKVLLNEIEEMQDDIRKLRIDIENFVIKRDVGVARIAAMQKELRGTISQVDSFVSSRDRKGLLMAGADRALRELASIFKDDPIEGPLQEASMSVWARMQFED